MHPATGWLQMASMTSAQVTLQGFSIQAKLMCVLTRLLAPTGIRQAELQQVQQGARCAIKGV